ncbi:MAG: cytochrome c oxidase subunit II [Planctomycetes bacterium]|nr:cytochrome c oxidase subunit II [Planctomycetota bacterium]
MYSGASEIARQVDAAFYWIGGICVVLLIGITAVMVLFVIRYRRARRPEAVQIEGSLPLEVTWIVVPTLIVLFMFFKGYEGFKLMRAVPEDAQVVEVVGQRWFWTFIYPEQGITSDRLYAPVGRPIKLEMTAPADDVVHSLYLPAFRVKEDCVPGKKSYLWFQPEQEGRYHIFCAEYCGKDHSRMITELVVLSPEQYLAWLGRKVSDRNKPVVMAQAMDPDSAEIKERDGAALFKTFCVSCHGPEGLGGLVENARDFTKLEGWKRSSRWRITWRRSTREATGRKPRPRRSSSSTWTSVWARSRSRDGPFPLNRRRGRTSRTPAAQTARPTAVAWADRQSHAAAARSGRGKERKQRCWRPFST